eukprot:TRINITY_DN2654_c0_g1_i2.p2 TRINITY_DN2654_c0_g1~~TRINITY_DN2654_c0_g1_i2.p2  ORF type:complete len:152 (+),score=46.73 TRINITY_DN2654_c0_g1_i2:762-1217(+)
MTDQELEELVKAFKNLDLDGDGTLSKEELIKGYAKFYKNYQLTIEEAEKIISEIDYNKSGKIDYSEFVVASINKEKFISNQKIFKAFQIFDKDNDGYIDHSEFNEVMGDLMNEENWQIILSDYDLNKDGKLSQEEFFQLLTENITSFYELK